MEYDAVLIGGGVFGYSGHNAAREILTYA